MAKLTPEPAEAAYAYPLILRHLFYTPLNTSPDQEIVYADKVRYDYRTLRRRIGQLASGLARIGVEPGDTVAVMDWDSHRYLECFFAIPMMGAVLHTVNIRLSPEQILYTINHAEDDVILVHTDFVPILEEIKDRIERPLRLVLLDDGDDVLASSLDFASEYEALLSGQAPYAFQDFDEQTRATTFYTTGTTGDPKGVYYTHRQLVLHTITALAGMGAAVSQGRFHQDDVYMPITPMFHVHAWGIPYIATLMGVKQVYPGRYAPDTLLGLLAREKVTFSHCVPTIFHMLMTHPDFAATDLSRWKVIIGGSALPPSMAKIALDKGIDVLSGYGLSETCPILTTAQLSGAMLEQDQETQLYFRCKAGRPLPLVDLRVVDEEMRDLPHDGKSTGEVVVRTPWLTQGYLKNQEASEQLWRDGYLHTGDIGHIDADGYLKVTDRIKDVIKSGGEWISSLTLEDYISQLPGVDEVAAIGVPDERWGERPVVLIVRVADPQPALDADTVRNHLQGFVDSGALSKWALPERIEFVESIAKTSVGKINKKLLRTEYT